MKKLMFFIIATLFAFSAAIAQYQTTERGKGPEPEKEMKSEKPSSKKMEGTAVNESAKRNFIGDFENITDANWKRSENFDEVTFTMANAHYTAYYDFDGNLVGTTTPKTLADLPAKGQEAIKEKYKDYSVSQVILFTDNDRNDADMVLWATPFRSEDQYFAELTKGVDKIIVRISPSGYLSYFKKLE